MTQKLKLFLFIPVGTVVLILLCVACNGNLTNLEPTPTPSSGLGNTPGDLKTFPYIFQGDVYIDGEKVSENLTLLAKVGEYEVPVTTNVDGSYTSLAVGPRIGESLNNQTVTFCLINKAGQSLEAEETFNFVDTLTIKTANIDLNFQSLP